MVLQVENIYTYMVQNILKISHVFGQKIVLCYKVLNCGIGEGEESTKSASNRKTLTAEH